MNKRIKVSFILGFITLLILSNSSYAANVEDKQTIQVEENMKMAEGSAAGGIMNIVNDLPGMVENAVQNAQEHQNQLVENATIDPDDWAPDSMTSVTGGTRLQNMGNVIIGVVQTIGSIVSVAVLAVIGIKYMMGSVEERAEYKKTMMPYIIGAILVFGITNLLGIVVNLATSLVG